MTNKIWERNPSRTANEKKNGGQQKKPKWQKDVRISKRIQTGNRQLREDAEGCWTDDSRL